MKGRVGRLTFLVLLVFSAQLLPAEDIQYSVKDGETLFSISRKTAVSVDVLCLFNGIVDAAKVKVGTIIRVPTVDVVKKGDTLFGIARQYSVTVAKLLDMNKLPQSALIKVGDKLYIPSTAGVSVAETVTGTSPETAQSPQSAAMQTAVTQTAGVVLPLAGRYETEKGKTPGVVFFGASGDIVHSATAGEVRWAATFWGSGKVILIRTQDGMVLMYSGNRDLLVNVGDRVNPGTEIARLGETPQGGGVNLHVSIFDKDGHTVDPEKFFSAKSES